MIYTLLHDFKDQLEYLRINPSTSSYGLLASLAVPDTNCFPLHCILKQHETVTKWENCNLNVVGPENPNGKTDCSDIGHFVRDRKITCPRHSVEQ
jgi:hypothetical protein